MPSTAFVILGVVFVLAALLLLAARRSSSSGRPGLFAREEEEHARDQLQRLLADIQELSREHVARLDTKIRMLQQLLAEADARIRELRGLAAQPPMNPPAPTKPSNPLHERVYALADAGKSIAEIGGETGLERGEVELILGLRKMQP
ncbi:MAG: hypothetical protein HYY16_12455 [Planctomycetes bacterium]|nr:hypothetical protein [Planctomycetota bacterium]